MLWEVEILPKLHDPGKGSRATGVGVDDPRGTTRGGSEYRPARRRLYFAAICSKATCKRPTPSDCSMNCFSIPWLSPVASVRSMHSDRSNDGHGAAQAGRHGPRRPERCAGMPTIWDRPRFAFAPFAAITATASHLTDAVRCLPQGPGQRRHRADRRRPAAPRASDARLALCFPAHPRAAPRPRRRR